MCYTNKVDLGAGIIVDTVMTRFARRTGNKLSKYIFQTFGGPYHDVITVFLPTHSKSTMWLQTTLVVAVFLATARAALTDAELSAFQSGGGCGGSVSITEDGDNYVIESNGLPDHLWQCVSDLGDSDWNTTIGINQ